ncbi:unnamed protein product [Lupinus luteus]|uniref:Uncharacterized protein n=1 Tax=Lupinus luteus TaxID=3873 RepID=A0AAV1WVD0_LUPLU
MKCTSSSHAKESLQITQPLSIKKSLTRVYTLKLKKNVTRKSEVKNKLKSSRSIKIVTFKSQNLTSKKYESNSSTSDIQTQSTYVGNKSQRVITGRLSLKPVKFLAKMPTFKSKNDSVCVKLHALQLSRILITLVTLKFHKKKVVLKEYHLHQHQGKNTNSSSSRMSIPSSDRHRFLQTGNGSADSGLVFSADAKPRLKWTPNLHARL